MKKLIAPIIIITGFCIIYYSIINLYEEQNFSSLSSLSFKLTNAINKDLFLLKKNNQIPSEMINSLQNISVNPEVLESANLKSNINFKTKPDGKYLLEITILNENPNEKNGRYLIQYSIYERMTKNLEWEKFRVYNR